MCCNSGCSYSTASALGYSGSIIQAPSFLVEAVKLLCLYAKFFFGGDLRVRRLLRIISILYLRKFEIITLSFAQGFAFLPFYSI